MAEADYKRLGCVSDGCMGEHKAKGLCQMHYRQRQRGTYSNSNARNCAHCGDPFTASINSAMYCSKACKLAAFKGRKPISRIAMLADRAARIQERERDRVAKRVAAIARKEAAATRAAMSMQRLGTSSLCAICNQSIPYVFGRFRKYCSEACSRKSEPYRANQRANKARRKAIERGCSEARSLDPLAVFQRDKWRCRLCGIKTPKGLRGTIDPRAPELDHVVTIADGGAHTMQNTQCACRSCNIAKGRRSLGQLHLI